MKWLKKSTLFFLIYIMSIPVEAQEITIGTLLNEMHERTSLAKYPSADYTLKQVSSYDRRANVPGGENWFANKDNTNFLRREITENGTEWVMFEADKPGAIVRWWMTFGGFVEGAGEGIIRVYIDGNDKAVIEGTAFDIISGGQIIGPPLSSSVSELTVYKHRGHNLYLPITYAKSCKVTYQGDGITANELGEIIKHEVAIYYVINYREFKESAKVESFDNLSLVKYAAELRQTQYSLSYPFSQLFSQIPREAMKLRKLGPGESMKLDFYGENYIKALVMKLDADTLSKALRNTIISLEFDDKKTLTIPAGDFFGTGYQINPYETFYTKVYEDGTMVSAWPMPFRSHAYIEIINIGNQIVNLHDLKVYVDKWKWNDQSMYFGGSWKQFYNKQTGGPGNPEDLLFNILEGKGVYVGDLITLYNSTPAWWGEGDEKIYVDGETFPSHFGTGTEDYYGYAWARPEIFSHPFIAQPDGSGNLEEGTTVNIRFRSLDKIPFIKSLKMTMELWHWRSTIVNYAPVTFYYLRPGGASNTVFSEIEAKRSLAFATEKTYNPELKNGIIQGENMEPVRIDEGIVKPQKGKIWDTNAHLWWLRADVGDQLYLQFISKETNTQTDIELQLTKARDYGIVTISLNDGAKISFDGYGPEVSVEKLVMEDVSVKEGINALKITIKGKNDNALEGYMFGIDYLKIK